MKIETRRRLHEDHSSYHNDLVLIPDDKETKILDRLLPNLVKKDIQVQGTIRSDDGFNMYFLLTANPRSEVKGG